MQPKPIISYNTKTKKYERHKSILQASKTLKLNPNSIARVLNDTFKQTEGYIFCELCTNYKAIIKWKLQQGCKRGLCHRKKVLVTDLLGNSETYDSLKIAAESLKMHQTTVCLYCTGKRTNKHFKFQYV